jgi:predicted RNA-binding protein
MTQRQSEELSRERLIVATIAQIQRDIYDGELEALFEVLERVHPALLEGFLREAEHHEKMRWH